ncbi:MAG: HEPN domain-containing protein [Lachnospiraceae bacterium]|nr:HEPN domain-containing protein [Lachnospiraceae bacterium]
MNGAKILLENGCLKDSINRSYYAIFNALRSVLALEGVDFKRHSQVIGYFNKNYIHKKIIDEKYCRYSAGFAKISKKWPDACDFLCLMGNFYGFSSMRIYYII